MRTVAILLLPIFFMQCADSSNEITKEATLEWTGPLAADGCGFFITVGKEELKPTNDDAIPEEFKESNAPVAVTVKYQLLSEPETYSCGMMGTQMDATIKVLSIKRR